MTMTPLLVNVAGPILNTVSPPSWGELGVYFSAVLAIGGVIYTATATRRTGQEANAVQFSKTLLERVKSLEDDREEDRAEHRREIADVRDAQGRTDQKLADTLTILSLAIDFIGELYRWGRQGGGEPEPTVPEKLREWLGHLLHPSKED